MIISEIISESSDPEMEIKIQISDLLLRNMQQDIFTVDTDSITRELVDLGFDIDTAQVVEIVGTLDFVDTVTPTEIRLNNDDDNVEVPDTEENENKVKDMAAKFAKREVR